MVTEELITKATANKLAEDGWEIIAVHPPDGQGPFTIPKPPQDRAIERASYHPDIIAIKVDETGIKILIVECKVKKNDLSEDVEKLNKLATDPESLYFICFRCQKFEGGPELAVDYDELSKIPYTDLPIEFALAYYQEDQEVNDSIDLPQEINGFKCRIFSFQDKDLV